ncbi:glycosyltransferase [Reinekea blandensis]|uniref:Glycosyltransferase n=1 Tax=Reinekea blandensis MED297 TaxID=314283 RepID=A4B943_9GAMM|nr:hypothetical protein [Reinekea blandensis]EAR11144.1 hypothetical protein MED297_19692 [Reinekea sp. MED297] [Reinekea blandensis MED297]
MTDATQPILNFYLPYHLDGIADLPRSIEEYWDWVCKNSSNGEGKYSWTLQTYLYLKESGVPCRIATQLPGTGIVISHRDFLPSTLIPNPNLFLVCIKPDRKPHTWANYYILQSSYDPITRKLRNNQYQVTPSWPQPSLKPRTVSESRVKHIAFFGRTNNLATELNTDEWVSKLKKLGFNWMVIPMTEWDDYSDIDVTVSIRGWNEILHSNARDTVFDWNVKPPAKLTNSWLAKVPAIVGDEKVFLDTGEEGQDFLVARDSEDLIKKLLTLRSDPGLYNRLQVNGLAKAYNYSPEKLIDDWRTLFEKTLLPEYRSWMERPYITRSMVNWWKCLSFFIKPKNILDPIKGLLRG